MNVGQYLPSLLQHEDPALDLLDIRFLFTAQVELPDALVRQDQRIVQEPLFHQTVQDEPYEILPKTEDIRQAVHGCALQLHHPQNRLLEYVQGTDWCTCHGDLDIIAHALHEQVRGFSQDGYLGKAIFEPLLPEKAYYLRHCHG